MRIRKIVCPTDFSPFTDAALSYASTLAAESGAMLYIVHVDEYRHSNPATGDVAYIYVHPGNNSHHGNIPNRLDHVKPTSSCVFERRYLAGEPAREIVAFAERENVDLIVMGSHGRTGLSRLLMGSVAECVARRATCPVLIVKQPSSDSAEILTDDRLVLQ
jgi:universal stress protein A